MPILQYIDLQKGQMARKDQNYPIPVPACLIEIKPTRWSSTGGGQLGQTTVSLYLYMDNVTDTYDNAESESSVEILDNLDTLYEVVQGLYGQLFNPLNRVSDAVVEYRDRTVCFRTDFETVLLQSIENIVEQTAPTPTPKFKF